MLSSDWSLADATVEAGRFVSGCTTLFLLRFHGRNFFSRRKCALFRKRDTPTPSRIGVCIPVSLCRMVGDCFRASAGIALRSTPWASRKTSCCGRSRSATSGSCGCGSPTCSGFLKSVAVAPAELEGAFAEGIGFDGSAIEGFARVYEADMLAKPDPSTFQILPWRGEGPSTARMFCDIVMPDGSPSYADPRLRAQAHAAARPPRRASPSTPTPRSSSTCSRTRPTPAATRCRSTAAATSTTPRRARAPTSAARRSRCSSRWASRWSSATTRAAPASRRSTCATPTRCRTADNIMTFRTVIREVALSQGIWATLHAQAVHHAPRLGHAHARVAVRGRPQRVLRGRRGVPAVQDRPAVHRRHPAPRQPRSPSSPTSGSTPTSG